MKGKDYHRTIVVEATAKKSMKKIGQINHWWKKDFSGSAEKLKDRFTVPFGILRGEISFVDFIISVKIPNKKVVWRVTDCYLPWFEDRKEWNNTKLFLSFLKKTGKLQLISFILAWCRK